MRHLVRVSAREFSDAPTTQVISIPSEKKFDGEVAARNRREQKEENIPIADSSGGVSS
jgi:hypothetical protein